MKIGLIQLDGKIPNLALMKLSKFYKAKGDSVFLIDLSFLDFDLYFGSKIFMGGSGYNIKEKLPNDIDILVPDYELYNKDYSIGYTSRGCVKDCNFCIVREKEGNLKEIDFKKDIKHIKYLILDNNFLANKNHIEKLKYFIDNNIKVSFTQGLDFDYVTDANALLLSIINSYDHNFKYKRLYFAFDSIKKEDIVREKLEILLKYIKPYKIMVYILVGFDSEFKDDMKRFEILRSYGVDPFIMIYNNRKDIPIIRKFARWVNKRVYKANNDFDQYKFLK